MRVKRDDTIAIVVDYQEKLMPSIFEHETVVRNSSILINGLNALGIPLIATEQYPKGLGKTIPEITEILGDSVILEKMTFSSYLEDEIKAKVDSYGKKNVIVMGIESHICVLQTVIDLKEAGYNVILVSDCISSRKENDKAIALRRAEEEGALLTTYESILFELTEVAGTPEFKIISKLIR